FLVEIGRQPADRERFEGAVLIASLGEAGGQLRLPVIGEDANDGQEGVRILGIVPVVLISKRDDEEAIPRVATLSEARQDLLLNPVRDLLVERHIIVAEIRRLLEWPRRSDDTARQQKEEQENGGAKGSIHTRWG